WIPQDKRQGPWREETGCGQGEHSPEEESLKVIWGLQGRESENNSNGASNTEGSIKFSSGESAGRVVLDTSLEVAAFLPAVATAAVLEATRVSALIYDTSNREADLGTNNLSGRGIHSPGMEVPESSGESEPSNRITSGTSSSHSLSEEIKGEERGGGRNKVDWTLGISGRGRSHNSNSDSSSHNSSSGNNTSARSSLAAAMKATLGTGSSSYMPFSRSKAFSDEPQTSVSEDRVSGSSTRWRNAVTCGTEENKSASSSQSSPSTMEFLPGRECTRRRGSGEDSPLGKGTDINGGSLPTSSSE
ncbi:unnamed protein product, partial [Choristocarpus tenellus]